MIEEKLKELILNEYGSLNNFCKLTNIPWSTIKYILTNGIGRTSIEKIIKICNVLNLDLEMLSQGILQKKRPAEDDMLLACHFTGDEYTEEELNEIKQFAEFVKSKRR